VRLLYALRYSTVGRWPIPVLATLHEDFALGESSLLPSKWGMGVAQPVAWMLLQQIVGLAFAQL
jgi:hypothetical protein